MFVSIVSSDDSSLIIFSSAREITALFRAISSSTRINCATPSPAIAVCSMCALDRKPKIPILVINISSKTAIVK